MSHIQKYLTPNWPQPKNIHAFSTTRLHGFSEGEYASFNLGNHVGDNPEHVAANRERLLTELHLPTQPLWLNQTHSNHVIVADAEEENTKNPSADASITTLPNVVCAILTADCLPILLCNQQGTEVAAIHAGWRGLASGIIENTLEKMHSPRHEIMAWLGPAIGGKQFEVGEEVYQQFINKNAGFSAGFKQHHPEKWLANLFILASYELYRFGITAIYSENTCTFSNPEQFFSYRRDGQTGRMATLIWFTE